MSEFAPYPTRNTTFVVKNITLDRNKTIKIFNYPINYNRTRDLMKIPGISEADVRASLLKGELNHKIRAKDIEIIDSDIDLLQFDDDQKLFLINAGVTKGLNITIAEAIVSSPTDILVPPPSNGDQYFNTVLLETMQYDGVRGKWLSVDAMSCHSGRLGSTAVGGFYRAADGLTVGGIDKGIPVPKGTLIGLSYSKTDSLSSTLEVLVNNVVVDSLSSSVDGQVSSWTRNADFNEGVMQFRNKLGGNTTTDVQITAIYKRRI